MDIRLRAALGGATAVLVASSVIALMPTAAATPPPPECSQGEEHAGRTPSPSPRPSPENCSSQSEAPRPTPAASGSGRATPTTSPTPSATSTSDPGDSCSYDIVGFDGKQSFFIRRTDGSLLADLKFVVNFAGPTCQEGTYRLLAFPHLLEEQKEAAVPVPVAREDEPGNGTTQVTFTATVDDMRSSTNVLQTLGAQSGGTCIYLTLLAGVDEAVEELPGGGVPDVAPDGAPGLYCNGEGNGDIPARSSFA